ncbi:hypothetical protein SDC9_187335 [bioreactor metagenome]|uniref:Tetratricopeptide repeat protein n=1 Tax=bioreactor metagenome TaxID=1076179 RepID=A0A645HWU1_9ZZZZ
MQQVATEAVENRKKIIFSKAEVLLKAGEGARGKAMLRSLGEDFGHESGVLTTIGSLLMECGFAFDAIVFFEEAIEAFPRDPASYGPLAACYTEFQEFEKGERLYLNAIREFGTHPRTMINLAKLYIAWNKRYKAFVLLSQVLQKDPDNEEAKEIFILVDR